MTQQQIHTVTGTIEATDTKRGASGKGPYRFQLKDQNNQSDWYSWFDKVGEAMLEKGGIGSAWTVQYTTKAWSGNDGVQRISNDVVNCKSYLDFEAGHVAPAPAHNQSVIYTPPPIENHGFEPAPQEGSVARASSHTYSDKDVLIVRQVAFKEIENKGGLTPNQLDYLTNLYTSVVLGTYIPEPDADDEFINTEI